MMRRRENKCQRTAASPKLSRGTTPSGGGTQLKSRRVALLAPSLPVPHMGRARAPVPPEPGFTLHGCTFHVARKYQPLGAIGHGSYGVVCSVRNTETNETLAIKKITPMAADAWDATHTLRELRLMRYLGAHENIISLKDVSMCHARDEVYLMMDLADTDLHRVIQSACTITEGHVRVIMYQLLSGLKAMHDHGVLHRDLKPGNLLLNKDCELQITDFGLARMMPKHGPRPHVHQDVAMMTEYVVTRWYRPPELMLAPTGTYDGAIDMWSVGCIFGELVARRPLFPGTDFMDQLARVFQVFAVPEIDDRGYAIEPDALTFLASLPAPPPRALATKVGEHVGALALDLLSQLLSINPTRRPSVDTALAHSYFTGVQDEWGEIAPLDLPHSVAFAFDTQALSLAALREAIENEVRSFRQPERQDQEPLDQEPQDQEPQDQEPQDQEPRKEPHWVTLSREHTVPPSVAPDCPAGTGFRVHGCDFNVPRKYHYRHVLGHGSYGLVCAATDLETQTSVAIKKITPMAQDEWTAKQTLRDLRVMRYFGTHPNIASLQRLSTCVDRDEVYLIMDVVDTDLHRLIHSQTELKEAHVAAIVYQLVCGAQALHENGVMHGDLKPSNVLVSHTCDVTMTAFGRARYSVQGTPWERPVRGGTMPEDRVPHWYRAPELMLAPLDTGTAAVDMWSIGCIFGELLTRRPLFPGTSARDQLVQVFKLVPVPPRASRGFDVPPSDVAFLETLPPCSPAAWTQAFGHAPLDAQRLLGHLLCVNPAQRLSATDALQDPYFTTTRNQLGTPPVYRVDPAFALDFDAQGVPLAQLKSLIQCEVQFWYPEPRVASPQVAQRATQDTRAAAATWHPARDGKRSEQATGEDGKHEALLVEKLGKPQASGAPRAHDFLTNQHRPERSHSDDGHGTRRVRGRLQRACLSRCTSVPNLASSSTGGSKCRLKARRGHTFRHESATLGPQLDAKGGQLRSTDLVSRLSRSKHYRGSTTRSRGSVLHVQTAPQVVPSRNPSVHGQAWASIVDGPGIQPEAVCPPERVHASVTAATASLLGRGPRTKPVRTRLSVQTKAFPASCVRRTHAKSGRAIDSAQGRFVATQSVPIHQVEHKRGHEPMRGPLVACPRGASSVPISRVPISPASSSIRASALPKEWARRSDPQTGRLFYVNVVTNRSYAKLPSSVAAAMLHLGRHVGATNRAGQRHTSRSVPFTQVVAWHR